MMDFDHILSWRLLPYSHQFPGPDGGTCLNEVAAVVHGFPYRKISSVDERPPCFSRPITAFSMRLNDDVLTSSELSDEEAQGLLRPFILRLAGTADASEIEWQRTELLVAGLVREVAQPALRRLCSRLAIQDGQGGCRLVKSLEDVDLFCCHVDAVLPHPTILTMDMRAMFIIKARSCARSISRAIEAGIHDHDYEYPDFLIGDVHELCSALRRAFWEGPDWEAAGQWRWNGLRRPFFWNAPKPELLARAALLDRALAIGRRAETPDIEQIKARIEAIKTEARHRLGRRAKVRST